MAASDGASSINVAVRVRPFTIREAAQITRCDDGPLFLGDGSLAGAPTPKLNQKGIRSIVKVIDDRCLVFDPPEDNPVQKFSRSVVPNGKRVKDQTFAFDRIFDQNASQGEVYESTTRSLLDNVLDGYNATVFAYGATGCGKTHTITGTAQQPGIIFLTMQELFERIDERSSEKSTEVTLSYLEIYNETIRDLLVPSGSSGKGGLMLREDSQQTVSVAGLTSHHPHNVGQVMDMIMQGNERRTMSPTEANATSSRSHAVLQINIAQKDRNADVNEPHTMATFSIIDLAGSERASATNNRGARLFEGANINKSLLSLGSCINALCDPRKRNHIPYRNSKLTRLLKFALGGNCKTVMIVCVSPSSQHFDETQNTLRYANRAKNIQTKVTRNVFNVNRHVKDFLVKIDEQMNLINELKAQAKDHEKVAFSKFRKQGEKKDAVLREGVSRIRNAYEHTLPERQERTNNMLKSRQISRRIAILSSWIAAFDNVCATRENEEGLSSLHAVRKSAQGILLELEGSRHHYNQRLSKSTWDRPVVSAVENAAKQLKEFDIADNSDYANLNREADLLRSSAEREALSAVAEQDKAGEAAAVQLLLEAQFELMASIKDIMQLNASEAIQKGRTILSKMLDDCSNAASNLVKPDGSMPSIPNFTSARPPSPTKPKKRFSLVNIPTASTSNPPPVMMTSAAPPSPTKGSPRRRRATVGRKSVSFTPKKSQAKPPKRSVRWRDDEQEGDLTEFQKTPKKAESTDEYSSEEPSLPPRSGSPIPRNFPRIVSPSGSISPTSDEPTGPVEPTLNVQKNNSRFQAGFLSKKNGSSPLAPPPTSSLPLSRSRESSPLRDIEGSSFMNRPAVERPSRIAVRSPSGNLLSSPVSENRDNWKSNKEDAIKINSAMRRMSSGRVTSGQHGTPSANALRVHRRRSPTAAAHGISPSDNHMFTASQARRMVKSEREHDAKPRVLSPHTLPVMKNTGRRSTLGDGRPRNVSLSSRDAIRLSAMAAPPADHSADEWVNADPRPSLTHANPLTLHFLTSTSPLEFRMSFAAPPASTLFSRFFRPFSTGSTRSLAPDTQSHNMSDTQIATIAAGCFWGVEHLYRKNFGNGKGLLDAKVGYCGGLTPDPSYRSVCSGTSGHAEALQVTFDPSIVTYRQLLEFFYRMHDPTTPNRQGPDVGTQYRSAIFTHGAEQQTIAEQVTQKVGTEWYKKALSTQIVPAGQWWDAEDYHQLYLSKNPAGYECPAQYVVLIPSWGLVLDMSLTFCFTALFGTSLLCLNDYTQNYDLI
ncbi:unnamed protein product [Penicillium salamii]|uniref:peptide-methionine (S)-S-oxide reductase n=1 Tax=Penicillium salamii TaxID=1612424 RepID=A0A9W4NHA2_9EURO|nr:unnamed protein product [Penicillium salamii]CAG8250082.1 unnamed protein product [Penicillium salamii]CAG8366768.1 unnamed protein product [Penicillium salamii]CAG8390837.1 unnamed protein product [Penicillium salamii]CAG8392667.1 unnamed protein product [Penicillium salamii]